MLLVDKLLLKIPRKGKCGLKHHNYKRSFKGRYSTLKYEAKKRNLDVTITLEQYKQVIENNVCVYCEYPLNETSGGLDRLDSSKGYSIDNVAPCCKECNAMKNNFWTYKEFMEIGKVIKTLKDRKI